MGTRFVATYGNTTDPINDLADRSLQVGSWNDAAVATTSFTLTAAQMINGDVRLSGQAAITVTTPTAAAIVAALKNAQVQSSFDFVLINTNSGTATLAAGSGVTLVGTTTAATVNTRHYKGIVTNATVGSEAVSVVGLFVAPN